MNVPMQAVPMRHRKSEEIPGWGADLESSRRPGIPRETNQENVLSPHHHQRIEWHQVPGPDVELTIERREYPPVLGNSKHPSFVSRYVRRLAFKFSEDNLRHWLLLLFADRLNMVEGWVEDLARGRAPMLFGRMEFRTTDHLRRALKQGPKSRQDRLLLASAALLCVGMAALAWRAVSNRRAA
jgi:hypothetical protein